MSRAVDAFLVQFYDDQAAGRIRTLAEYLTFFPSDASGVRSEFECLQAEGATARTRWSEEGAVERIGPYVNPTEIGRGAQGVVYLAADRLGRAVAVKVLYPSHPLDQRMVRRFEREALAASRVLDDGIPRVLQVGVDDGRLFIAMDYVRGISLLDELERHPSGLTVPRVLELGARLAGTLGKAHAAGIVHRDVKPANIMIREDGLPMLLDFGLSAVREDGPALTRTGDVVGSPAYMSPEQVDGALHTDQRSDVWAMGVILYETLTGKRPFSGTSDAQIFDAIRRKEPASVRRLNPRVGRDLEAIIECALSKERACRYRTGADLADDLHACLGGAAVRARRLGPLAKAWRWARSRPALASLLIFLFVGGAVATVGVVGFVDQRRELVARQTRAREAADARDRENRISEAYRYLAEGDGLCMEIFDRLEREGVETEVTMGRALFHVGRGNDAEARRILLHGPGSRTSLVRLIAINDEFQAKATQVDSRLLQSACEFLFAGCFLRAKGEYLKACEYLQSAVALQPGRLFYLDCLCRAAHQAGAHDWAEFAATRMLAHWPDAFGAHYRVGWLRLERGQHAEAIARLTRSLEIRPDDAAALTNLGHALQHSGRIEEARRKWNRAIHVWPNELKPRLALALSLHTGGSRADVLQAASILDAVWDVLVERDPATARKLIEIYQSVPRDEKAVSLADQLLARDANDYRAAYMKAFSLARMKHESASEVSLSVVELIVAHARDKEGTVRSFHDVLCKILCSDIALLVVSRGVELLPNSELLRKRRDRLLRRLRGG